MTLPNFLIIGAAKAGTSSLYAYLKQHPQIYMSPEKEPRYFAPELYTIYNNGVRQKGRKKALTFTEYCQLFSEACAQIAIGEASTEYLYIPQAAARIKDCIPKVKLITILRNPIERAFSAFCYQLRDGYETLTFEQALQAEAKRIKDGFRPGWHYKQVGFYYAQVKQYLEKFPPEQIQIYLYDELQDNSIAVVQDIYKFLGVEATYLPDLTRQNQSGIPKNRLLQDIFTKDNPLKSAVKPFLPSQLRKSIYQGISKHNLATKPLLPLNIRQELIELYREDIGKLQTLIQKDLSHWLISP
jgi:hypothetical protein